MILCNVTWSADPDSVAQGQLIATHFPQLLSDMVDQLGVNVSLVGAAHDTGDVATHLDVLLLSDGYYIFESLQRFILKKR